jgi:tetratricopeptide (TPR) repeat protein
MGRFSTVFGLVVLAIVALAPVAWADDWDACENSNPDVSIFGCTAIIDAGTETQSNLAIAHTNRGLAYGNKSQHDRAIKDYDKAIALNPKIEKAFNNRGVIYADKGQHDRAIKDYDKAIALNPKYVEAHYNRGNAYFKKRQFDRAIKDFDTAIALNPRFAEAHNNRGFTYSNKGQYDRAIKDYDKAIALNPKYAKAYNNRGVAFEKLGKLEKAKAEYRKVISLRPGDKDATERLKILDEAKPEKKDSADKPTTGEKTASSTKGNFKHFANTDFVGTLLSKTAAGSAGACDKQCNANAECEAFSFNVWNAVCFLKKDVTAQLLEPGSISGLPASASRPPKSKVAITMARYRGKNFSDKEYSSDVERSMEACEATCKNQNKCVAWTFVNEGGTCELYATVGEYSDFEGADSGAKRQVGN